jgi:preprotein translocase subunit SecE
MESRLDWVKWFAAALLVLAMAVANYVYAAQAEALRLLWNILAGLLVLGIASFTDQGKRAWLFAKEARVELRKVVWPGRQETIQSTVMIMLVVVITALFLWGVDSILLWAMGFVTGQRG